MTTKVSNPAVTAVQKNAQAFFKAETAEHNNAIALASILIAATANTETAYTQWEDTRRLWQAAYKTAAKASDDAVRKAWQRAVKAALAANPACPEKPESPAPAAQAKAKAKTAAKPPAQDVIALADSFRNADAAKTESVTRLQMGDVAGAEKALKAAKLLETRQKAEAAKNAKALQSKAKADAKALSESIRRHVATLVSAGSVAKLEELAAFAARLVA
jgi:hypothetical protein